MLEEMDEESVMVPCDEEEYLLIDCWTLALQSGFANAQTDSGIVMLFCEQYELDKLEVLRVCKHMTNAFNSTKQK
jgi:hypothetical protein